MLSNASSLSSMKYANYCLDRHCPLLYMPRFKIVLCFTCMADAAAVCLAFRVI